MIHKVMTAEEEISSLQYRTQMNTISNKPMNSFFSGKTHVNEKRALIVSGAIKLLEM